MLKPDSAPDLADRMRSLNALLRGTLSLFASLTKEMLPRSEPNWIEIQRVFASLKVAEDATNEQLGRLRLHFRSLRPDPVIIPESVRAYSSQHSGFAALFLRILEGMNLRWEAQSKMDGAGTKWCPATNVNWLSPTLDLPSTKSCRLGNRTRTVVWNLADEDYRSENTSVGVEDAESFSYLFNGWSLLRRLDLADTKAKLRIELDYAVRQIELITTRSIIPPEVPTELHAAWRLITELNLRGQERGVMELVCLGAGTRRIVEIAMDKKVELVLNRGEAGARPENEVWKNGTSAL